MYLKIAKKSLLIFLLFIITIYGIIAPVKTANITPEANAVWSWFKPKTVKDEPPAETTNKCSTCFVAVSRMSIWNMLTAPLDTVLSLIPRILVFISKWIVILLASILSNLLVPVESGYFYDLNRFTSENGIVFWIWKTSLYYANIMITLFLIWIAINIILEKKEYTSYQSLIKLLVVALLINFSLVICTLFVDISNYLTVLFMSNVSTNAFSCLYACVIHKVANMFNCMANQMVFSQTIGNSVALMIAIIFIGQLLGLIIYVLVRMVYLWFLVGVSPIAFVLSAIPETRKLYGKWLDLFKANLIKLPVIAFASYFILNLMIHIANRLMSYEDNNTHWWNSNQGGENFIAMSLGTIFLIIILGQALLAVAQNLGVEQISKASAAVSGWAKKGLDAVRKPAVSYGAKKLMTWKPVQDRIMKAKDNKNFFAATLANKMIDKTSKEQKLSQQEVDKWKGGKNVGMLERTVEKNLGPGGDHTKFLQALQALSELKSKGDYKGNFLENQQYMSKARQLIKDDVYGETDAGSYLKKRYTWMKAGPDYSKDDQVKYFETLAEASLPVTGRTPKAIKQKADEMMYYAPYQTVGDPAAKGPDGKDGDMDSRIYRKMHEELYERATKQDKFKLNDWNAEVQRLYEATERNNNPGNFVKVFEDFYKALSATKMRQIFGQQLVPAQRKDFWRNLAKMAIVARDAKIDPTLGGKSLSQALKDADGNILSDAEQALVDLAPGSTDTERRRNSWMAEGKSGKEDSFRKMLINNHFITPKTP